MDWLGKIETHFPMVLTYWFGWSEFSHPNLVDIGFCLSNLKGDQPVSAKKLMQQIHRALMFKVGKYTPETPSFFMGETAFGQPVLLTPDLVFVNP